MTLFKPFKPRVVHPLSLSRQHGWRLKRYRIMADNRTEDEAAIAAATAAAFARLPTAGRLEDADGNHGVGFQIFHFSEEIPLVSPVFYWTRGSVLSHPMQMRSYSEAPYEIVDGVPDVVGCIWEMEIVTYEITAWRNIVLADGVDVSARVERYLRAAFPN